MNKILKYRLKPEIALDEQRLEAFMVPKIHGGAQWKLLKRSIDARGRKVSVDVEIGLYEGEGDPWAVSYQKPETNVSNRPVVLIVGTGPAGLFAALRCLELGAKPVLFERGKDVKERRRDLAKINKEHIVNPDSNYCFGEGGAGTYSDGKLYTRSKKRGDVRRILEMLVVHGASEDILKDTHPHIGTNKLPKVIADIRETILSRGGEIYFNSRVTDIVIEKGEAKGIVLANGDTHEGVGVILATGHSARDIFELLEKKKITIESKPFALGVRVEHPQTLIDSIQYHCDSRGEYLPAAPYALTTQTRLNDVQRGVFSFCMCPGGFIVPSATAPGEVVVNGMSPSRRDSKFANSGIVVAIENQDLKGYHKHGNFAALAFQSEIEKKACVATGGQQKAPAQRLSDFIGNQLSQNLPDCSYQPGLVATQLSDVLPEDIYRRLVLGFKDFGKKSKGYVTAEAVVVGVESRTSSPVHVPRKSDTWEHIQLKRLFPCGEGAGYAGGIMSAAIDGEKIAEKLIEQYINV
ncbi:FAD-binding protein [Reichenbachiella carrageenanivorans]|uniref:FAD-binding protein n=1 Tax=Reichenbachiella carrageenanivorans TaxID=2979869 RepID=A0ABY6D0B8_9BACT|nr:FAD-binding protein [Reichenbachiella carrageenanivorans]UXX79587.1 FAD-binding protein [Reichenbachiella carrageenanivorans]